MATCLVSGNFSLPDGNATSSVTVAVRVPNPQLVSTTGIITPASLSVSADASGNFSITVQQSLNVIFTVSYPVIGTEPMRQFTYTAAIPAAATASFNNIITVES